MGKNDVCSQCGQVATGYASAAFVSPSQPGTPFILCGRCAADQHASTLHSIEEADQFIADAIEQIAVLEKIISKSPKMPEVPEGLGALAMTPLTVYRTLQAHLAAFKSRRLTLITEAGSEERLQYEIRQAIEAEDYELAGKLQKQLDEKTKGES